MNTGDGKMCLINVWSVLNESQFKTGKRDGKSLLLYSAIFIQSPQNTLHFVLDIDECKTGVGVCAPPGTCVNTLGSYRCFCPRGFKMDKSGTQCRDEGDDCADEAKCKHSCQVCGQFFL